MAANVPKPAAVPKFSMAKTAKVRGRGRGQPARTSSGSAAGASLVPRASTLVPKAAPSMRHASRAQVLRVRAGHE